MDALIELDTINCRAKHAEWLSAIRPSFYRGGQEQGSISISGAADSQLCAGTSDH